jgi:hypothetical protein
MRAGKSLSCILLILFQDHKVLYVLLILLIRTLFVAFTTYNSVCSWWIWDNEYVKKALQIKFSSWKCFTFLDSSLVCKIKPLEGKILDIPQQKERNKIFSN